MTPNPDASNLKKNPMRHVRKWFHQEKSDKSEPKSSATVVGEGECVTTTHDLKKKLAGENSQSKKVANDDPGDAAGLGNSSQTPAEQSKPQAPSSEHLDTIVEQANLLEKKESNIATSLSAQDFWPDRLWDEAYKEIRKTNEELLIAYQKYLLKQENENQKVNDLGSAEGQALLHEMVVNKLDDIKKTRLRIPIYAKRAEGNFVIKKVVVREQVCNIVRGIQSVSSFIGAALSPSPPAALAWAGVLVLLPIFLNASTKDDDAMKGLEDISDLLVRCKVREDVYRKRIAASSVLLPGRSKSQSLKDLHDSLARKNVELYSNILKYQIQLAIHYHGGLLRRSVGDFVVSNDWRGMMEDLEKATEKINRDLSEDDRNMITEELLNLKEKSEKSMDMLKDIQDRIMGIGQDSLIRELPRALFAAFDSYQNPRETTSLHRTCLEGTRVDIRNVIQQWTQDLGDDRRIFWLRGMPGTGKSTIARTVASSFALEGRLGGSFFFSKGQLNPHNATQLFTTLASQIADVLPDVRSYISSAIEEKRDIGGKQLFEQWDRLILKPLLALDSKLQKGLYPSFALVLVIDALDECEGDEDVEEIVRLFSEIKGLKIVHLRVFMTSRPESFLRARFGEMPKDLYFDMDLSKVSRSKSQTDKDDIMKLVEFELAQTRRKHHFQEDWPGEEIIEKLAQKADGLFIYAATACRFLEAAATTSAVRNRLETIFDDEVDSNSPQQNLDKIYAQILRFSVADKIRREKSEIHRRFRQILGPIVLLFNPLSIDGLGELLSISRVEIEDTLRDLYSIIDVPESQTAPIQMLHLSFPEFLLDLRRCPEEFVIDRIQTHNELVKMCLKSMSKTLKRDICGLKKPGTLTKDVKSSVVDGCLPDHVQYACRHWIGHLIQGDIDLCNNRDVHKFFKEHFLHWLEALGLLGSIVEGFRMIIALSERLPLVPLENKKDFHAIVHDAKRFVLNYRPVLEIAPLQVYNSALLFSPMKSNIKLMFSKDVPVWIKRLPKLPETWSASLQFIDSSRPTIAFSRDGQFLAHTSKSPWQVDLRDPKTGVLRITLNSNNLSAYNCLEFSPDSKLLACASMDPIFEIWDLKTRKVRVIDGHSDVVNALAFSPDGKSLVTASDDKSARLWNPHTGESKAIFTGHSDSVHAVAFSPNGQLIASASYENNIRLWSIVTRESCGILRGHLDEVWIIAFSPDSRRIASGSNDKTVRLWDLSTLTSLKLTGHSFAIHAVSFSPNGQLIISGSRPDGMIRLWDPKTGASLAVFEHHSGGVTSISFSPDNQLFASASSDKTVRIWNATTRKLHATLEGHLDRVYDVRFSPDGRLVATASSDGTVRLWDPQVVISSTNIERHSQHVSGIAFSLDGQVLASSSYDKTIKIWDPFTGALYRTLEGYKVTPVLVEFSPDGEMLVSADNDAIRIWNPNTGISLKTLKIDSSWIDKLSFSPSSKLLASGAQKRVSDWKGVGTTDDRTKRREDSSSYRNVRVWDTNTGECYCGFNCDLYECHVDGFDLTLGVEALVFSQDEKLLTALTKGEIWIWNLETKELVQKLDRQEVTLQQPLFDLVSESERDTSRDMLTRNFPSLRLEQSEFERALYVKGHWVTWRKQRILWLPPEYRPSCFRVRDNILAMGHRFGRLTFIEFDLDRMPLGGSIRNEL